MIFYRLSEQDRLSKFHILKGENKMKNKTYAPKRAVKRMYMATVVILLALLANACNLVTVYGSGNISTKNVDVHDFNRVVFSGSGELMLSQGDEETVAVAADNNLIKHIYVEVRDETLYIWHRETISPSRPIQVRVTVKEITALELSGIVNAKSDPIIAEDLDIVASGLVTLKVKQLEAKTLTVNLNGSSEFELTDTGKVTKQEIILNGSNDYNVSKLESQDTTISLSGSNNATVWAVETMNVTISGNGSVQYYGSPQVSQIGSGNAKLINLGDQ